MSFNNHWIGQSEQEVTVHLKNHVWRYNPDGPNEQYLDLKGEPKSMTVKVKRYGMSRREKLAIVVQAALKHFNDDVNSYMHAHYLASTHCKADDPEIVIEEKFLKWIAGETYSLYLDKDHKIQYTPPKHFGTAEAMLASTAGLQSLEDAKKSCPVFLNEKPPNTKSMTDLRNWVGEKQAK